MEVGNEIRIEKKFHDSAAAVRLRRRLCYFIETYRRSLGYSHTYF